MSLSLKDKWRKNMAKALNSKADMNKSLVSYLNHRDIFDVADLKSKLPNIQKLSYDRNPDSSEIFGK